MKQVAHNHADNHIAPEADPNTALPTGRQTNMVAANHYAPSAPKLHTARFSSITQPGSEQPHGTDRTTFRRHRLTLTAMVVLMWVLAGCEFGAPAPTPTPFAAPTYSPGFEPPAANAGQVVPGNGTAIGESTPDDPTTEDSAAGAVAQAPPIRTATGSYAGEIIIDRQVTVVSEVGGMALVVPIEVGQRVRAGDLLVRVDSSTLEAQRAQALAGLEAAQAQRELLNETANDSEIEAARAGVAAADAAYKRALEGPTPEDIIMAEAQVRQAQAAVDRAQAAYDQVAWSPIIGALPESLQLEQATLNLEAAQAQYDKVLIGSTADVIAGAYAQLAQARAQLERVEEGPVAAQIQAVEAQVRQAEAALYLAQLQLDKAAVRAPMDGIILNVNAVAGSMVAPGSPVATIISSQVKVTIRVEENRLSALQVGQPAQIRVNAYPDRVFEGQVSIIAPTLDASTRTVEVTIRPDDPDGLLAPGMFAAVELFAP